MPGHVEGQVVAARPDRPGALEPADALLVAALGLVHMGDRVQRPGVRRLVLERDVAGQLGRLQLAAFLEAERMATLEKAVARHRRVPGRQHGRGGRQHPCKSPRMKRKAWLSLIASRSHGSAATWRSTRSAAAVSLPATASASAAIRVRSLGVQPP